VLIARMLGHDGDADRFDTLASLATKAFQAAFVHHDGTVHGDTQTAYAISLGFGLVPPDLQSRSADRLAHLVLEAGTHLATGFVGTPLLLPALSEHGHHELACELMREDGFPGWLHEVRQGATTIWERWDGWTAEKGFTDPGMNSFNHYAFGSVADWMHRHLAGLAPAEPGYRRTVVRPGPAAGLTSARASHVSLYGRHAVDWAMAGDQLTLTVEVPANTSADVVLPNGATAVVVDGRDVSPHRGDRYDPATLSVASGPHVISWVASRYP
jgi:alpha-L-rhamnosidase